MDYLGLIAGITGVIVALTTLYTQKRQSKHAQNELLLAIQRFEDDKKDRDARRQVELDTLEHDMVITLGTEYKNLIEPLRDRIVVLENQVKGYKEELEAKEAEVNQLEQTNSLYEGRMKFLEESLETLSKKYNSETARLQKQIQAQNKRIRELEAKINDGDNRANKDSG